MTTLRATAWADYQRVVQMFADWPTDSHGPCTPERTRMHMERWLQQFHSFVWEVEGVAVGLINCNHDYTEITHAVVHPDHRGQGHFSAMTRALAESLIWWGVSEMGFDALDQAAFIADKYHRGETRLGETGPIHRAVVRDSDFPS